MSPARIARTVLLAIAVLLLSLGAISARVVYSGERELALSTDALKAGDPTEATVHARRAAAWYAPGAPHVGVAYARLIALATAAEGIGDRETALFAWRAVRTAAIDSRWLTTPHAEDRARADQEIARLAASAPRPAGTRADPPSEIRREQLEALTRDESPDIGWVVVLLAGALAAGLGLLAAARQAVSATGSIDWRRARPALLVAAAGAGAYLFAVWRA